MENQLIQPAGANNANSNKTLKSKLMPTLISLGVIAIIFAVIWVIMSFISADKITDSIGLTTTVENVTINDSSVVVSVSIENKTQYTNTSFNLNDLGVFYLLVLDDGTEVEPSLYSTLPIDIAKKSTVSGDLVFDISGYVGSPTTLRYSRVATSAVDGSSSSFVQPYYKDLELF